MKLGEQATIKVKSNYAYGVEGNSVLGIPPNTDLVYQITLLEFTKEKESWEMDTFQEKEEAAMRRKNEGNKFFSDNRISLAIRKYKKAIDIFNYESGLTEQEKATVKKEIKLPSYLNLAACYIKTKEYKAAIENSKKALELDSLSVKGLWRLGCALTEVGEWQEAHQNFTNALQIEPDNKVVQNSFTKLKKIMAEQDKQDKKRFQNMFQRMVQMEEKET